MAKGKMTRERFEGAADDAIRAFNYVRHNENEGLAITDECRAAQNLLRLCWDYLVWGGAEVYENRNGQLIIVPPDYIKEEVNQL